MAKITGNTGAYPVDIVFNEASVALTQAEIDDYVKWMNEDTERHNAMCNLAREKNIVSPGEPSEPPKLNDDGSLASKP